MGDFGGGRCGGVRDLGPVGSELQGTRRGASEEAQAARGVGGVGRGKRFPPSGPPEGPRLTFSLNDGATAAAAAAGTDVVCVSEPPCALAPYAAIRSLSDCTGAPSDVTTGAATAAASEAAAGAGAAASSAAGAGAAASFAAGAGAGAASSATGAGAAAPSAAGAGTAASFAAGAGAGAASSAGGAGAAAASVAAAGAGAGSSAAAVGAVSAPPSEDTAAGCDGAGAGASESPAPPSDDGPAADAASPPPPPNFPPFMSSYLPRFLKSSTKCCLQYDCKYSRHELNFGIRAAQS